MAARRADADTDLDPRDARALTEYMTVLDDVGRVRGADGLYLVVSESGSEYLVDARTDTCKCPDYQYRGDHLGPKGCKHTRRVAYATGERAIPAWTDADAADPDLGAHVGGAPRGAAADGGQLVADGRETDATDGAGEGAALDGDARLAVHDVVCDLLAPRLTHLLDDFDAWTTTVELAAGATVATCERGGWYTDHTGKVAGLD